MVNIQLNEQELQKLNNLYGTKKQGDYSEVIVKHITEQVPSVSGVKLITDKNNNMDKGDIRYHRNNETHYIEVKKGKVWKVKKDKVCYTVNKAAIDFKYARTGSYGTIEYTQPYGLKYCWLYSNTYEKLAFVFSDKVYLIPNGQLFLDTVRYYVDWCIRVWGSRERFEYEWYRKGKNFPIHYGLTGGITHSNDTYETYTIFVDIEWLCGLHGIKYRVIDYKVTNVSNKMHNKILK